ncbi:MAG: RidA family protein [Chitinivibrionia bacterium]|nr:RidA family protein [Chitinivibrionia bacterium]
MKNVIRTARAPGAIGPYSQAVRAGDMLFVSGQIGINPATGKIESADVAGQARQVLLNLKAIVEDAGMGLENVVKTTIYLASMGDFAAVNEVYGGVFDHDPPARATIEVSKLPLGALVEIEAVAQK